MSRKAVERNISYDEDRKRYYVTLQYGKGDDGKPIKQYKCAKTLSEARRLLRTHEVARDKGIMTPSSNETLEEWMEYWLANVVRPNREETTYYCYQQMWKNHLQPVLGKIKLKNLTPPVIQQYYTKIMAEKGLSPNTVRKHHDLLRVSLHTAVRQEKLGANPTDRVEPPKARPPDHSFYGPTDLQRLLQLPMDGWLRVGVFLAGYLGLRREEICGLRWDCVNFQNHQITIKHARTSAGSKLVEKAPKNKSSERILFCPPELESVLQEEFTYQKKVRDIRVSDLAQEGYVVCWSDGEPVRPNYLSDRFSKLVRDNGLPRLTLHGLRHTFASIANAQGSSLFDIGKALGHSTPSTTGKIYTHLFDQTHQETVSSVAQAIKI